LKEVTALLHQLQATRDLTVVFVFIGLGLGYESSFVGACTMQSFNTPELMMLFMRFDGGLYRAKKLIQYLVMHGFHLFQTGFELKWRLGDGGKLETLSPVHTDILGRQRVLCLIEEPVSLLLSLSNIASSSASDMRNFDIYSLEALFAEHMHITLFSLECLLFSKNVALVLCQETLYAD
jgi:hypothetical protein